VDIEKIASAIVHSAIAVHKALGPGLLESVYQECLSYELKNKGLKVRCEVPIPVRYREIRLDTGFRADMLIEECVLIENKTVEQIAPIHEAQLLTYLKLSGIKLGFILNWNVVLMRKGIRRMVNKL
jgi:GxxExxY protein